MSGQCFMWVRVSPLFFIHGITEITGPKKGSASCKIYPLKFTIAYIMELLSLQPQDDYSVLFEDTSYPDGYSPPLLVAQRYVICCKEDKKKWRARGKSIRDNGRCTQKQQFRTKTVVLCGVFGSVGVKTELRFCPHVRVHICCILQD